MNSLRVRLSLLYFLQFAVWGCYLTCFGQLLGAGGLGDNIAWFYAAIGLVSLVTPALMGHIADRYIRPQRLLGLCHVLAAVAMSAAWLYAGSHPHNMQFGPFFCLYLLFLAFYMPTMGLINTSTFALLKSHGRLPVDAFPAIRVWGTVGFVAAMWFVNCAYWYDGSFGFTLSDSLDASRFRFQYTAGQLMSTAVMGFVVALYTLCLPTTEPGGKGAQSKGIADIFGLKSFSLFKIPSVRTFLVFAAFGGVCLQISNGFATPFITHFAALKEYAGSFAAGNATLLFSLSQIAEAGCLLLVGVAMKRLGIRLVITIALIAWCLRFLFFGLGNPGDGLWLLAASMIVYGIAFNFFTIAGHLYMEQCSSKQTKGFGQGLMMLMSNGIGATLGTLAAGGVVNHWCSWQMLPAPSGQGMMRYFMGDWQWPWFIFALYSLCVGVMFFAVFRQRTHNN